MTPRKLAKQRARVKDFQKKKNILRNWTKAESNRRKAGLEPKGMPVRFPQSKKVSIKKPKKS